MDGVQNLPPHVQGQFMQNLEQMQMKDSLTWVDSCRYMLFLVELIAFVIF